MRALQALGHALGLCFGMFWQILWALVRGFGLPGCHRHVRPARIMTPSMTA